MQFYTVMEKKNKPDLYNLLWNYLQDTLSFKKKKKIAKC